MTTSKHKGKAKKKSKESDRRWQGYGGAPYHKVPRAKGGTMIEPLNIIIFHVSDSPATRTLAIDLQQRGAIVPMHNGRNASPDRCVSEASRWNHGDCSCWPKQME